MHREYRRRQPKSLLQHALGQHSSFQIIFAIQTPRRLITVKHRNKQEQPEDVAMEAVPAILFERL